MPTQTATTTDLLLTALAAQQHRVIGVLAELDDQTLRRVVLPSGWSCAGMVQHLTLGLRFWLGDVMGGQTDNTYPEDDFAVAEGRSGADLLTAYAQAARDGAKWIRDLPLTTPPAWWPEGRWGGWRLHTLHDVLLHLLVETAAHAGHLDVARELIDGRTWDNARDQLGDAP